MYVGGSHYTNIKGSQFGGLGWFYLLALGHESKSGVRKGPFFCHRRRNQIMSKRGMYNINILIKWLKRYVWHKYTKLASKRGMFNINIVFWFLAKVPKSEAPDFDLCPCQISRTKHSHENVWQLILWCEGLQWTIAGQARHLPPVVIPLGVVCVHSEKKEDLVLYL